MFLLITTYMNRITLHVNSNGRKLVSSICLTRISIHRRLNNDNLIIFPLHNVFDRLR